MEEDKAKEKTTFLKYIEQLFLIKPSFNYILILVEKFILFYY